VLGLDPLQAERSELERFLARGRRGRWRDWEGPLSTSTRHDGIRTDKGWPCKASSCLEVERVCGLRSGLAPGRMSGLARMANQTNRPTIS
jgi:hypothetical protein